MPRFSIRTAAPSDIDAVLGLWHAAGAHQVVGGRREGLERLMAQDREALLVAARDGELIGTLIAAWDGWRGSFYRLAVHPGHRREGLATALLREGERRLGSRNAERLTAIVAEEDSGAREFWDAAGYEQQAGRARFVSHLGR